MDVPAWDLQSQDNLAAWMWPVPKLCQKKKKASVKRGLKAHLWSCSELLELIVVVGNKGRWMHPGVCAVGAGLRTLQSLGLLQ